MIQKRPNRLEHGDRAYYARDYISKAGFSASEANQLVNNFKKPVSTRNTKQWYWKQKAIDRFALELTEALPGICTIAFIPPSKIKSDPEYDPRFEMLGAALAKLRPGIVIEEPLERITSCQAVHLGGDRDVYSIRNTLGWSGFNSSPDHLILIDDVITWGTHFKACQQLVHENYREIEVVGVFWACTIWQEPQCSDFFPDTVAGG